MDRRENIKFNVFPPWNSRNERHPKRRGSYQDRSPSQKYIEITTYHSEVSFGIPNLFFLL